MHDFITAFLAETDYAPSTRESYRYALTRLEDWLHERGWTVDDLTAERYLSFLNGHGWSSNMRRLYASAVRVYLRWLGYGQHPVLKIKLPRDNSRPGRSLEQAEVGNLLASFDTTTAAGWRNVAMLALMVESGLRISEVCRLALRDVDIQRRSFVVLAKREKWRPGVFSEITAQYLANWLARRPAIALPGVATVFVGTNGKTKGGPMTPGGLRKLFRNWGIRSEVGRLSPHDLRRTMATLLTEAGAPSRLVQVLGGWDDIRMVERYTRNLKPSQIDQYSPLIALMVNTQTEKVRKSHT